ncbi:MAG: crossover junction endodeoxyribonuclease RuvC [Eubacteriales bacterium]|nr:crossover junction endodeoxyribonuclease RuvC [Eubacteriales bacterium]
MIIIGIDPGIAIVGYGVVDYRSSHFTTLAQGALTTPAGTETSDRLLTIYTELDSLIKTYKPSEMAVEELFFNTNQKTAMKIAEARGVITLCAKMNGLSVYEYTPLQVKQAVVGYGRAEKAQVVEMIKLILNLNTAPKPDDAADALAIAVCHAHTGCSRIRDYYNK